MKNIRAIILCVISVVCFALIGYFVFFFGGAQDNSSALTTIAQKKYSITFDSDTLSYTKGVDFMDGVSAVGENGENLDEFVTVSCKPTSRIAVKELTYSVNKSGYELATFSRKLVVDDDSYNGPSIKLGDEAITVPFDQIGNLSSYVSRLDCIITDDGFGGGCAVSVKSNAEITELGDYVVSITIENILGDTKTVKTSISVVEPESSIIKLKSSSISLNRGEEFVPQDYVKSAYSKELGDISQMVVCTTDCDTSKAGIYKAEYHFSGINELENERAILHITVK